MRRRVCVYICVRDIVGGGQRFLEEEKREEERKKE